MVERHRPTPPRKKADRYDRERRSPSSPGVGRSWSEEKERSHRRVRRKSTQLERHAALAAEDPEAFEAVERRTLRTLLYPTPTRKPRTPLAGDGGRPHRQARVWQAGWDQFFHRPYDPARHREPARRYLETLTEGHPVEARRLARHFRSVLAAPRSGRGSRGIRGTTARWLDALFEDEPAVGAHFRRWVEQVAGPVNRAPVA